MSQFLLFPVFFPFLAGPFAYWIGCWYEKARNTFVMSAAALELFLVLTLWTKPELAQATAVVEGFCGMGIQLRAGGFHTLMALLTATGWMAATVFCREYMIHVHKRNRFYLFWLMTLGATMGVFLSGDLFTAFLFFEVMSFTSFVLVIQTEEYPALKAGETYLAVAVIGGAGGDYLQAAALCGADTYLTGELRHHEWMAAQALPLSVYTAGHYATEAVVLPDLLARLSQQFPEKEILICGSTEVSAL